MSLSCLNPYDQQNPEEIFYIGTFDILLNFSQKEKKNVPIQRVLNKSFCGWKTSRLIITNLNIYIYQHPHEIPNNLADQTLKNYQDYLQEFTDILSQPILKIPSKNKLARILKYDKLAELIDNPSYTTQTQNQNFIGILLLDDNNEELYFLRNENLDQIMAMSKCIYLANCWQKYLEIVENYPQIKMEQMKKMLQILKINATQQLSFFEFCPLDYIEDEDFQILIDFTKYTHFIQRLSISADFFQNLEFNKIKVQEYLHNVPVKSLLQLSLENTNLSDETLQYLISAISKNQNLLTLNLSHNYLSDNAFAIFMYFMEQMPEIQELNLQNNHIKCEKSCKFNDFLVFLNQFYRNFKLNLSNNYLSNDIVDTLEKNFFFVKNIENLGIQEINLQNCSQFLSKFMVWRLLMGYKYLIEKIQSLKSNNKHQTFQLNLLPLPYHPQLLKEFTHLSDQMQYNFQKKPSQSTLSVLDIYYQNIIKKVCELSQITPHKNNTINNNTSITKLDNLNSSNIQSSQSQQNLKQSTHLHREQFLEEYYNHHEDELLHNHQVTISITRKKLNPHKLPCNKKKYIEKFKQINEKVQNCIKTNDYTVEELKELCDEIQFQEFEYPLMFLTEFQEFLFDKLNESILIRDHYCISYLSDCCKILQVDIQFFKDKFTQIEERQQILLKKIENFLNFSPEHKPEDINSTLEELIKEALRIDLRGLPVDMLLVIKEKRDQYILQYIDEQDKHSSSSDDDNSSCSSVQKNNSENEQNQQKNEENPENFALILQENLNQTPVKPEFSEYFREDLEIQSEVIQHITQVNYQYLKELFSFELILSYQQILQQEIEYNQNYYVQLAYERIQLLQDDFIVFDEKLWYPAARDIKLCALRLSLQYSHFQQREVYQTHYYYLENINTQQQQNFVQKVYDLSEIQSQFKEYDLDYFQYLQKNKLIYINMEVFEQELQMLFIDLVQEIEKQDQQNLSTITNLTQDILENLNNQKYFQDQLFLNFINYLQIDDNENDQHEQILKIFCIFIIHMPPTQDFLPYLANFMLKYTYYNFIPNTLNILSNYYNQKLQTIPSWAPSPKEMALNPTISVQFGSKTYEIQLEKNNFYITIKDLYTLVLKQIFLSDKYSYWLYTESQDTEELVALKQEEQLFNLFSSIKSKQNPTIHLKKRIYSLIYSFDVQYINDYPGQVQQIYEDQRQNFVYNLEKIKEFFPQNYQQIQQLQKLVKQNTAEIYLDFLTTFSMLPCAYSSIFYGVRDRDGSSEEVMIIVNSQGIFIVQKKKSIQFYFYHEILYTYSGKDDFAVIAVINHRKRLQKIEITVNNSRNRELIEDLLQYNSLNLQELNEILYGNIQMNYYIYKLKVLKKHPQNQQNKFDRTHKKFDFSFVSVYENVLNTFQNKLEQTFLNEDDLIFTQPFKMFIKNKEKIQFFQLQKVQLKQNQSLQSHQPNKKYSNEQSYLHSDNFDVIEEEEDDEDGLLFSQKFGQISENPEDNNNKFEVKDNYLSFQPNQQQLNQLDQQLENNQNQQLEEQKKIEQLKNLVDQEDKKQKKQSIWGNFIKNSKKNKEKLEKNSKDNDNNINNNQEETENPDKKKSIWGNFIKNSQKNKEKLIEQSKQQEIEQEQQQNQLENQNEPPSQQREPYSFIQRKTSKTNKQIQQNTNQNQIQDQNEEDSFSQKILNNYDSFGKNDNQQSQIQNRSDPKSSNFQNEAQNQNQNQNNQNVMDQFLSKPEFTSQKQDNQDNQQSNQQQQEKNKQESELNANIMKAMSLFPPNLSKIPKKNSDNELYSSENDDTSLTESPEKLKQKQQLMDKEKEREIYEESEKMQQIQDAMEQHQNNNSNNNDENKSFITPPSNKRNMHTKVKKFGRGKK